MCVCVCVCVCVYTRVYALYNNLYRHDFALYKYFNYDYLALRHITNNTREKPEERPTMLGP